MSSIYINEPPTKGKVLVKTTLGDLDVELWSKETPLACRNFVQLCLDGYYNGTIFHRVIRDFMAQGGDPTGTGEGGESASGKPFKDEFHSRLKFLRRGLVAMANGGRDDNASQFFITLGRTDELNKMNTIFGKVTGDTLFNLIKFNELMTDKTDRPLEPPKITRTEVLSNPFDDIVPRSKRRKADRQEEEVVQSTARATKNYSLLSFGEEAEEDEEELDTASKHMKIRSSHDVLTTDNKLASEPAMSGEEQNAASTRKRQRGNSGDEDDGEDYDLKMRSKVLATVQVTEDKSQVPSDTATTRVGALKKESEKLRKELRLAKKLKEKAESELEKKLNAVLPEAVRDMKKEFQSYVTKQRMHKGMKGGQREEQTLDMLSGFKARLFSARSKLRDEDSGDGDETTPTDAQETTPTDAQETMPTDAQETMPTDAPRARETTPTQETTPTDTQETTDSGTTESKDISWFSHQITFEEERRAQAKDAVTKGEDYYDIYDPRNSINKRRRNADAANKPRKTKK